MLKRWKFMMEDRLSLTLHIGVGDFLFEWKDFALDLQILEDYFSFGLYYKRFAIEYKSFSEPVGLNPKLMKSRLSIDLGSWSFSSFMYQDWFTQSIRLTKGISLEVRMDTKNFNFGIGFQSYNPWKYVSLIRLGKKAWYST